MEAPITNLVFSVGHTPDQASPTALATDCQAEKPVRWRGSCLPSLALSALLLAGAGPAAAYLDTAKLIGTSGGTEFYIYTGSVKPKPGGSSGDFWATGVNNHKPARADGTQSSFRQLTYHCDDPNNRMVTIDLDVGHADSWGNGAQTYQKTPSVGQRISAPPESANGRAFDLVCGIARGGAQPAAQPAPAAPAPARVPAADGEPVVLERAPQALQQVKSSLPPCQGFDYRLWNACVGTVQVPRNNSFAPTGSYQAGNYAGIYHGEWRNGRAEGSGGRLFNLHGNQVYIGEFHNWLPNGRGTYTDNSPNSAMQGTYVGGWRNGEKHGDGIQTTDGVPDQVRYDNGKRTFSKLAEDKAKTAEENERRSAAARRQEEQKKAESDDRQRLEDARAADAARAKLQRSCRGKPRMYRQPLEWLAANIRSSPDSISLNRVEIQPYLILGHVCVAYFYHPNGMNRCIVDIDDNGIIERIGECL